MPVSPSNSLIQALSNLVPPAAKGPAAAPAKPAAQAFQQHIDGVLNKRNGQDQTAGQRQQHAANTAPPPPPPGRGSIINLLV